MRRLVRSLQCFAALVFVGAQLSSFSAVHADFRVEVEGSFAEFTDFPSDAGNINLSLEAFLDSVDDSSGPFGEAAFLTRASSVFYQYDRTDVDDSELDGFVAGSLASDGVTENHQVGARYVLPDSGWIFTGLAERPESRETATNQEDGFGLNLGVGRYLNDSTTLEFTFGFARQDFDTQTSLACPDTIPIVGLLPFDCQELVLEASSEVETFSGSLELRRVGKIASQTFATTLLVGFAETELSASDSDLVLVDTMGAELAFGDAIPDTLGSPTFQAFNAVAAATWYVTRNIGIDLDYTFNSAVSLDVHSVGTGVGWFISPTIELRGNYIRSFPEVGADGDLWRVTLRGRF